jgi:hypothetical protein
VGCGFGGTQLKIQTNLKETKTEERLYLNFMDPIMSVNKFKAHAGVLISNKYYILIGSRG